MLALAKPIISQDMLLHFRIFELNKFLRRGDDWNDFEQTK